MNDRTWQCKIRKHLEYLRGLDAKSSEHGRRIYANQLERENMASCHQAAVLAMEQFIDGLPMVRYERALEVGCGDGRVTRDQLLGRFKMVDLFDPCSEAIRKVREDMAMKWQVMNIGKATMETHEWNSDYSLIVMRWCIGYPEEEDLVAFLREAKQHLVKYGRRTTRNSVPRSFILVLDNVLKEGHSAFENEGQMLRDQWSIEKLFRRADLTICMQSERIEQPPPFEDMMMWALY